MTQLSTQCAVGYHVTPNKWHHIQVPNPLWSAGGLWWWWGCGNGGVVVMVTAVLGVYAAVLGVYAVHLRNTIAGGHPYWSPTSHLLAISGNISYTGVHLLSHTDRDPVSSTSIAPTPLAPQLALPRQLHNQLGLRSFHVGNPTTDQGSCDDEAMWSPIICHLTAASSWNTVTEHPTLENWWIIFSDLPSIKMEQVIAYSYPCVPQHNPKKWFVSICPTIWP